MEHFVDIRHIEVAAQTEVLGPPVVPSEERMHILQSMLSRRGIAQVPHIELRIVKLEISSSEYLRDGILALGSFAEHIFHSGRSIQADARNTSTLLTTVVLLFHHQIEFVQAVAVCAVSLLVIGQRFQQAYHGHTALML